jgi:beta-ribofuranosylaminobenzene 5'-phosphate synthase
MEVTVRTPSRLHFAMVDLRGDLGRLYGSVGVAIDRPNIVLKARLATNLTVEGPSAERAEDYAEKFLEGFGVEGGAEIVMISDIRAHVGFGSGTQLALAVGTALSELHELGLTTEEIARKLERSRRSGIGAYAFKHGGFIVDGGHRKDQREGLPPLIFHSDVPEDWLFVIGLPDIAHDRSGKVENDVFKRVEPPPGSLISHHVIEEGVNFLLEAGAYGVGQSSWGPAFYGLVRGESDAKRISKGLRGFLNSGGRHGESFVARPDNRGAVITVSNV